MWEKVIIFICWIIIVFLVGFLVKTITTKNEFANKLEVLKYETYELKQWLGHNRVTNAVCRRILNNIQDMSNGQDLWEFRAYLNLDPHDKIDMLMNKLYKELDEANTNKELSFLILQELRNKLNKMVRENTNESEN